MNVKCIWTPALGLNKLIFLKPDTIEVQQMKAQAREDRVLKQKEREKLALEVEQREAAEREKTELETRLRKYEEDLELQRRALDESNARAQDWKTKMAAVGEEKEKLEAERLQALHLQHEAETMQEAEREERERKEEEVRLAMLRLEENERLQREREEEAARVQAELDETRLKMEEQHRAMEAALAAPPPPPEVPEPEEANEADDKEDAAVELTTTDVEDKAGERLTQAEKNRKMQDQLKTLSAELAVSKDQTMVTKMDDLHAVNQAEGRDKYKTLKQIRMGNTKQRVDQFEMM